MLNISNMQNVQLLENRQNCHHPNKHLKPNMKSCYMQALSAVTFQLQ